MTRICKSWSSARHRVSLAACGNTYGIPGNPNISHRGSFLSLLWLRKKCHQMTHSSAHSLEVISFQSISLGGHQSVVMGRNKLPPEASGENPFLVSSYFWWLWLVLVSGCIPLFLTSLIPWLSGALFPSLTKDPVIPCRASWPQFV